jgi:hypothetical protein
MHVEPDAAAAQNGEKRRRQNFKISKKNQFSKNNKSRDA